MKKEYCTDENNVVLYSFNVCDFCAKDVTGEQVFAYDYDNFTEYACLKCAQTQPDRELIG